MRFLNGVCRHEPMTFSRQFMSFFLNGVCRHEPGKQGHFYLVYFLNGVCRHEHEPIAKSL